MAVEVIETAPVVGDELQAESISRIRRLIPINLGEASRIWLYCLTRGRRPELRQVALATIDSILAAHVGCRTGVFPIGPTQLQTHLPPGKFCSRFSVI